MRFYNLVISNAAGQVYQPNASGAFALGSGSSFSSLDANGNNLPGALNIEFDVPITQYDAFQGGALIRIWGVGLQMIGQAADLSGQNFQLSAGMSKGLPLANPAQQGVILQGQIFQGFGNWSGINQTIDLVCNPGELYPTNGVSFNWRPGTPLSGAIYATLRQAFPNYKANVNISANLQPPMSAVQAGCYSSLQTFTEYLTQMTQPLGARVTGNANYPGVTVFINGTTINVSDATRVSKTVPLAFVDLIGQPTWIAAATITFKTVLRGDIQVGDQVTFPLGIIPSYALTTPGAAIPNAPSRNKTAFQGSFTVQEVHHYANFRQPDAESWNTTFTAVPSLNG